MESNLIKTERRGPIEFIQLNRPEKLNALTREMILTLNDKFKHIEQQADVRAIILSSAGDKAFCSGTDIEELAAATTHDHGLELSERGQQLGNQIESCGVPVIAAVNGVAAGGGCELALACHLRIASTTARFSLPETKLGVIPAYGGTRRLTRELGQGRALELMLTGKTLSAEEALAFGLVNRVSKPADLLNEAESLALEIASLAPLAIRACLKAVIGGNELPLCDGLQIEAELFANLFTSEDVREGTRAFLEKRQPNFKGR
ncbi:MAG TPA: enoyl-CoA hydratase/isomerase family protein [Pyrinomonadaceae bacterium]|jgi:enoyl-CoA hydratase